MVQCGSRDASSSIKLLSVACVPGPTWMVMLLVAVQEENTYDETLKEMLYDESNSSLPR